MDPSLLLNLPASQQHLSGMATESCSENCLKFICEFKPGPGTPQPSGDEAYSVNTDCELVSVILPAQCSVYQLRLRICMQVGKPHLDCLFFRNVFSSFFFVMDLCIDFMHCLNVYSWASQMSTF